MTLAWGIALLALGLLAWGGQTLSWLSPRLGARLGVFESEDSVDPAFWADARGEVVWDAWTLWTLPAAGLLLILDQPSWAYLGLIGGSIYVYFGGRGVMARRQMNRRGLAAGTESDLRGAFVMLPVWAVAGLVTIVAAINEL